MHPILQRVENQWALGLRRNASTPERQSFAVEYAAGCRAFDSYLPAHKCCVREAAGKAQANLREVHTTRVVASVDRTQSWKNAKGSTCSVRNRSHSLATVKWARTRLETIV